MTARQRLGNQDHIGFDVPVFDREEPARSTHSGLDLVCHHQGAILAAERGRAREKFVGGHVDALALDRLDNEGGHFARRQGLLERGKIIEWYRGASGQQRLESAAEVRVVGQRKRAVGQSVVSMRAVDDTRPAGRAARELDRSFDTFRAGIGKKHLVQIWDIFEQPFRKHAGQGRNIELHEIRQIAVENALQCVAQRRMVPPDRKNAKSAE